MGIPLVALQGQGPEIAKQIGQVVPRQLSLRKLLDEQRAAGQTAQMNDLKIAEAQRAQQEQQALSAAYNEAGGDIDKLIQIAPSKGVSAQTMIKLQDTLTQYKKSKLDLEDSEWKAEQNRNRDISTALDAVAAVPLETQPAAWDRAVQELVGKQKITPEEAQQFGQYPGPDGIKRLSMARKTSEQINQQIDNERQAAAEKRAEEQAKLAGMSAADKEFQTYYDKLVESGKVARNASTWLSERTKWDKEQTRLRREGTAAGAVADIPTPTEFAVDPESQSILAQTGLSLPAFMALTGSSQQLPRDAATRNRAFAEASAWARKRGIDTSTLISQYKTYNDTLGKNIARLNNTKIMESELQGTIQNLQGVVQAKDLGKLNFANVARIWAGQQVNDNLAQQYAVHLFQLRNELAAYMAAAQGRSGNEINLADQREAEGVIRNGISAGSLAGLATAVENSTGKMGTVMEQSVDRSRKAVWDLFGVGSRYKPTASQTGGDDKVLVINPQGQRGRIPRSQLADALAQGYKEAK